MNGACCLAEFPDPALIDLGLERLTASPSFPDMRTSPSTVTGVGTLKQTGAHGRFQCPLINIQISARPSKTLRPSALLAAKSRIWSRHASSRLSRPPRRNRMELKRPAYGAYGHSPHRRGRTQSTRAPRAP